MAVELIVNHRGFVERDIKVDHCFFNANDRYLKSLKLKINERLRFGTEALVNHHHHGNANQPLGYRVGVGKLVTPEVFKLVAQPVGHKAQQHHQHGVFKANDKIGNDGPTHIGVHLLEKMGNASRVGRAKPHPRKRDKHEREPDAPNAHRPMRALFVRTNLIKDV